MYLYLYAVSGVPHGFVPVHTSRYYLFIYGFVPAHTVQWSNTLVVGGAAGAIVEAMSNGMCLR